jgi:hypothetical protein
MMGMNPMQLMQMFKGNPQQAMQQLMGNSQFMNNPMAKNFMNMAQQKNFSGIEELGRNMAKERGVDFDKEFEKFKSQFGMK